MKYLTKSTLGIIAAGSFGFCVFGYDGGVMSGILTNKLFLETFNYPNDTMQGQITGLFDLGCFFGAIMVFCLGDRFGRKTIIITGAAIHAIGGAIQCSSFTVAQMIVGRIVAGFGNGFITVGIPVWVSETVHAKIRGSVMTLMLAFNLLGIVIVTFLNYGMRYIKTHFSWRFPLGFQMFFALATLVLTPFFPESPRWLISKGRNEKAKQKISQLLGKPEESPEVESMYTDVIVHVEEEQRIARDRGFWDLFKRDKLHNLRRVLLGAGSQLFQQWGGINVVLYYMPVLFQNSLGLDENLSLILAAINSVNMTVCLVLATFFVVERVGRRKLMLGGSFGQGTCFLMVAVGLAVNNHSGSILSIFGMFLFYSIFGFSWCFMSWLYPPEINSQQYRNLGAGIATATNWISNYVVVVVTPVGVANIKWKFYLIFCIFNYAFLPILYFFFEETKGLALEEVDELFLRKNGDALPVHEDPEKLETKHIE
jgi:sugar porter (SP) family MFS transporter